MRQRIEWVLARSAFPVAIVASVGGAIVLIDGGRSPETVTGIVILLSYAWLALLERVFPLHSEWGRSHGDLKTDVGLAVTNAVVNLGAQPLVLALAVGVATWMSQTYGAALWPTNWPLLAQLVPALIIGELVEYSCHRAMHEIPWLWRFHAPHHSAKRLYWFNALRFHPLDILLIGPGKLLPLVALGADGRVLALVLIFSAVHGTYQHANLPCRLGPLNWVFSMAELHRWHHSPITAESNHNYGGNLIFWDILFGTRWLPSDREPPVRTGIEDLPHFPPGFASILASPFRWRKVVQESGADTGFAAQGGPTLEAGRNGPAGLASPQAPSPKP
ncbi:MAG: sterol desaturase family protein [Myxococcota bacterium]|nr:sterol desaturase family protein [Myxococcota bacterium]